MVKTLNVKTNPWYAKQNHVRLNKSQVTKMYLDYGSGESLLIVYSGLCFALVSEASVGPLEVVTQSDYYCWKAVPNLLTVAQRGECFAAVNVPVFAAPAVVFKQTTDFCFERVS